MKEKYLIGKTKFCYSVIENDVKSFLNSVTYAINNKYKLIELRLENLILSGLSIDLIINIINTALSMNNQVTYIAVINTVENGHTLVLSPEKYYTFIKKLYYDTSINIIELNSLYYQRDKDIYDNFLLDDNRDKEFILTYYFKNNMVNYENINEVLNIINYDNVEIVKVLLDTKNKDVLFNFMSICRKLSKQISKNKKIGIFIALNKIGLLSQVYFEYTNTRLIYINDRTNGSNYGISNEKYTKFREKIHFLFK